MTAAYAPPAVTPITVIVDGRTLTTQELVVDLAEGNPGAATALLRGMNLEIWRGRSPDAFLLSVWSSRLRGPALWQALTYESLGDVAAFVDLVEKLAASGGAR